MVADLLQDANDKAANIKGNTTRTQIAHLRKSPPLLWSPRCAPNHRCNYSTRPPRGKTQGDFTIRNHHITITDWGGTELFVPLGPNRVTASHLLALTIAGIPERGDDDREPILVRTQRLSPESGKPGGEQHE